MFHLYSLATFVWLLCHDIPLIVFDPQQRSNFLGIGESLCLDGRIWQKHGDQKPNDHSHSPNSDVEDSPVRESRVGKADSVCDEASENLSERVANIEPRHTSALLFLLVPHCNDQYQNRGNTVLNVSVCCERDKSSSDRTYQLSNIPNRVRAIASPANVVHAAWNPRMSPHSMIFMPRYNPNREICCARYCVGNSATRKPKSFVSNYSLLPNLPSSMQRHQLAVLAYQRKTAWTNPNNPAPSGVCPFVSP